MKGIKITFGLIILSSFIYGMDRPEGHQHWMFSNQSPQAVIIWQPTVRDGWSRQKLNANQDTKEMIMRAAPGVTTYLNTMAGNYLITVENNKVHLVKESLDEKVKYPAVEIPYEAAMDLMIIINPNGTVSAVDRKRVDHPAYLNIIKPKVIELVLASLEQKKYDLTSLSDESLKDIIKFVDQSGPAGARSVQDAIEQSKYFMSMNVYQKNRFQSTIHSTTLIYLEKIKTDVKNELKRRDIDGNLEQMLSGEINGSPYPLHPLNVDVKKGLISAIDNLVGNTEMQQTYSQNLGVSVANLLNNANALKKRIENHLQGK